MNNIKRIAIKELFGFFSSLTAFIFFGAFLAVTLFIFFWVDTFFSRNIADVRPMFEWMPVLLIFLVPSLTMRMWSEERRSGTLEFLLTLPATNFELVCGKFAACMGLILIALLLTLPLPITVSLLAGPLDWGPVIGGYIAAFFLAALYTAIGLTISARTDNQIVSLLISTLVCGAFLLVGSNGVTSLFSSNAGEVLKLIGSGSRFQSITRGIVDFRDLFYYISITGVFVCLNVLGLERIRWAGNSSNPRHKRWVSLTALCVANFIAGNFWLQQIAWARLDLTEGHIYSISAATRNYLDRLKEPLLIRGYFSKKTHPLLQPLIPRVEDLLKEYAIAGHGNVRVEVIDPLEKPELEKEAVEQYGIKPVVFQTANKYQAAITNSYFDILIKYGDQFQKLSWQQLVEVKNRGPMDVSVDLRNPEYDITSTIKKVLYSYQSSGNPFLNIENPLEFKAYVSPDNRLPQPLQSLKKDLKDSLEQLKAKSNGKLTFEFIDPDADGGKTAKTLESEYGLRHLTMGLFDPRTFWFYMMIKSGDQVVQVPPPEEMNKAALERSVQSTLKRFSKGFLKTIGICTPQYKSAFGMGIGKEGYGVLRQRLGDVYTVENTNLDKGIVPSNVDLLLLISPENFSEKQVFAVDQFLMKGGTVIIASSPFDISVENKMVCKKVETGLESWLKNYGIDMQKTMVLDTQNFPLPIPTRRVVNGYEVEETVLAPYPYFVNIAGDGLNSKDRITAGIGQLILNWPSAIKLDKEKNQGRIISELMHSSKDSWSSYSTDIEPNYSPGVPLGFLPGGDKGKKLLALSLEGSFDSYFKDKKNPLVEPADEKNADAKAADKTQDSAKETDSVITNVITKSPKSSRIILFGSSSFLSDKMMWLASASLGSQYIKPIELIQNAADWSLEDRDLLELRGRGHFARTLYPMSQAFEIFFEYLNYALAAIGLLLVWIIRNYLRTRKQKRFEQILKTIPHASAKLEAKK